MTARGPMAVAAAEQVVQALVDHGMRRVVAAPGSRNAPLLLALAEAERRGDLVLTMRIDERGAAFWALGQAKAAGEPVAVVTTSGTAVGNLLPAVMEAHHSGVPIMIISADRPEVALDTGANQTTHQPGIFGRFVAAAADVGDQAGTAVSRRHQVARLIGHARSAPGPVHLNVRLSAPLVGPGDSAGEPAAEHVRRVAEPRPASHVGLEPGPRTVVLAGDMPPAVGARALAACAGHPLVAEPSSNARSAHALRCARLLLAGPLADDIERVVVWGHPTLSRPQAALLGRPDVEVIEVGPGEASARAALVVDEVTLPEPDPEWLTRWQTADAELGRATDAVLAEHRGPGGWLGPDLATAVLSGVPAGGDLVIGSSNPVRDLDLAPIMEPRRVWANRGLAGIDGLIATASGIASVTGSATLLLGDISFAHDLTGLLTGPREQRPNLRIVVANDAGGSIFHTLEQGAEDHATHFERVFATPVSLDLPSLARAVDARYTPAPDPDSLAGALAGAPEGLEIVEAPVHRDNRRAMDAALAALARRSQGR